MHRVWRVWIIGMSTRMSKSCDTSSQWMSIPKMAMATMAKKSPTISVQKYSILRLSWCHFSPPFGALMSDARIFLPLAKDRSAKKIESTKTWNVKSKMVWKNAQKKQNEHRTYNLWSVDCVCSRAILYLWPVYGCTCTACVAGSTHTSMYELQGMLISWTKRGEKKM